MSDDVYVDSPVHTVAWDDDIEAVVTEWHEPPSPSELQECLSSTLSFIRERDAGKFLADARETVSIPAEKEEWIVEEWAPAVVDSTVEAAVVVYPEETAARTNVDSMARKLTEIPVDVIFTEDASHGRQWLQMQ